MKAPDASQSAYLPHLPPLADATQAGPVFTPADDPTVVPKGKRYALFAGDTYYPGGGWTDLVGLFSTAEAMRDALAAGKYDWWHIVDLELRERVVSWPEQLPTEADPDLKDTFRSV